MMKRLAIGLLALLAVGVLHAQSGAGGTNMDRDFWVMFLPNTAGGSDTLLDRCQLVMVGPDDASVTVATLADTHTFNHMGGNTTIYECGTGAEVQERAFHVTTTADVALFSRNVRTGSHDVALVIPTRCLGTRYLPQVCPVGGDDKEQLGLVATEDSTVLSMRLPVAIDGYDLPPDSMLHITLQRGECRLLTTSHYMINGVFNYMEVSSNNRPFALFQGNRSAHVPPSDNYQGGHLYEQAIPLSQWGHRHMVGGIAEQAMNYFVSTSVADSNYVWMNQDTAQGEASAMWAKGQVNIWKQEPHASMGLPFYSSAPVGVSIVLSSYGASGFCGGPSSAVLPSMEHGVRKAYFHIESFDAYESDHLVVFCDTAYASTLRLDGVPVDPVSEWDYLATQTYRFEITPGHHVLECDTTFVAFVYGLRDGLADSYAFPVGMQLDPYPRDTLYRTASLCAGSPFEWGPFVFGEGEMADTGTYHWERTVFAPGAVHLYRLQLTVLPAPRSELDTAVTLGDTLHLGPLVCSEAGTYVSTYAIPGGCDSVAVVNVYYRPTGIGASADRVCPGMEVTLSAREVSYYHWAAVPADPTLDGQQHSPQPVVSPQRTTTYSLLDRNGEVVESVTVQIVTLEQCVATDRPYFDFDHPVVTFDDCTGRRASSHWTFSDGREYGTPRVRLQLHSPLPDSLGVLLHTVDSLGCSADTSFALPVERRSVWFPNAFMPGSDGDNATFGCHTDIEATAFILEVYNRRGRLVWRTDDVRQRWDGTADGRPLPQASYLYRWHLTADDGAWHSGSGTVTIIR